MKNAIVLVSGGLDSVVLAHYLKKREKIRKLRFVFFDYNQKSLKQELFCVKKTAKELNAELKIIDMGWLGDISTSFINKKIKDKDIRDIKSKDELMSWYVPGRNALFLMIGMAIAESEFISKKDKYDVYIGIKYEGTLQFKDTTPEFLKQINKTAKFSTQKPYFRFKAPFLKLEKEDLIKLAKKINVPLDYTCSCYIGKGFKKSKNKKIPIHCGICGGCKSRKKAFKFSGIGDPTVYKNVQSR